MRASVLKKREDRKAKKERIKELHWGRIKDHYSECPECFSSGKEEDNPEEDCVECEGEGQIFWGSFYTNDTCVCDSCHKEKECSIFDDYAICLECYVESHKNYCGCSLWKEAEALVLENGR